MKQSKLVLGLVLASAIVTGCATSEKRPATTLAAGCNGLVNATVSNITLSPSTIDIDPEPICVDFNAGQAIVRWTFDRPGYVFPPDAVTFASGAPHYTGVVLQHGRAYQVVIDPSEVSNWKYTLRLQSAGSSPLTWTCDPTIINHGSSLMTRQTFNCTTTLTTP